MNDLLNKELETFEKKKAELLGTSEGKFVLIKGDQVLGTYDAKADAIAEGYNRFGNQPFLVKQVVEIETPLNFVSNHLSLRACHT